MNKFTARVRFKRDEDIKKLTIALFQEFNPESSFEIEGKEATMEIAFEQPPMAIIEAINQGEEIKLNYGKQRKESQKDEELSKKLESDDEKQPKAVLAEVKNDDEETKKTTTEKLDVTQIQAKLLEIKKQAKSFQHFAELVAEWLGMKRKLFFIYLEIASAAIKKNNEKITWKGLYEFLDTNHYEYLQKDAGWCSRQISQQLEIPILRFLELIASYEPDFHKQQDTPEINDLLGSKELTKVLKDIDSTWSVEQKVQTVLQAMGLGSLPQEKQEQLVKITTMAMKKERITDEIYAECGIPEPEAPIIRMDFYKFIEQFIKKYDVEKKVTVNTFLKELQKCIMQKDDMKKVSDTNK